MAVQGKRLPPSEFGGEAGLVQPPPHEPTTSERLGIMYRTGQNPMEPVDQTLRGDRRSRSFYEGLDLTPREQEDNA